MSNTPLIYDVVIAGAGPVGLFLACELRLAKVSVLVLERAHDPSSPLKKLPFGMRGLSVPTIESFHRRGLLEDITKNLPTREQPNDSHGLTTHWMQQRRRPGGHFAGIQFFNDNIDASKWTYRLPDSTPVTMASSMEEIEAVLERRATAMGAEIRRGAGVESVQQSDTGATVYAGGQIFHGRWLVGCDGGRSTVRKAGGFDFVGTDPEFTGYSVEVEMADPEKLAPGRHYTPTGMYTYQEPGTIAMVDFDGGR